MHKDQPFLLENKGHFQFTIHGIGHEYWTNGKFTRAEWADRNGIMRDREQVEAHLDYYEKIMNQHNLGSFPTSFVPTAFLHSFGISEGHTVSMAHVLKQRGVNYINTPFEGMFHRDRVTHEIFGLDSEVITVDRGRDLLSWKSIGETPEGEMKGPTCGLHWPNLLHQDPERNSEIVKGWVDFLRPYNEQPETLLAKTSEEFCHQLVHHRCTSLNITDDYIAFNFSEVDKLSSSFGQEDLILRLASSTELAFEPENVTINSETIKRTDRNIMYTLKLTRLPDQKMARLIYNKTI